MPCKYHKIFLNKHKLYYSQIISTDASTLKKAREEGYVYRWGQDHSGTLTEKTHKHYEFEEVWSLDLLSKKKQLITKFNFENFFDNVKVPLIMSMELASDLKQAIAQNFSKKASPRAPINK